MLGLSLTIACLSTAVVQETGDDSPITYTLYVQGGYIHFDDDDYDYDFLEF